MQLALHTQCNNRHIVRVHSVHLPCKIEEDITGLPVGRLGYDPRDLTGI